MTRRPDALDLRPGGPAPSDTADDASAIVVSGAADLRELSEIVETVTGVGTWPRWEGPTGEVRTAQIPLERPAAALALLRAMEGLIEERSPWRTWPTAVEIMAASVAELDSLTVQAVVMESPTPPADPDRPRRGAP